MFVISNKQKAIWFNKLQCGDCNYQTSHPLTTIYQHITIYIFKQQFI